MYEVTLWPTITHTAEYHPINHLRINWGDVACVASCVTQLVCPNADGPSDPIRSSILVGQAAAAAAVATAAALTAAAAVPRLGGVQLPTAGDVRKGLPQFAAVRALIDRAA